MYVKAVARDRLGRRTSGTGSGRGYVVARQADGLDRSDRDEHVPHALVLDELRVQVLDAKDDVSSIADSGISVRLPSRLVSPRRRARSWPSTRSTRFRQICRSKNREFHADDPRGHKADHALPNT